MFVLTKRTAPSDKGNVMHSIHGFGRCFSRPCLVPTDIVELVGVESVENFKDDCEGSVISEKRVPSWREEQAAHEKSIVGLGACARG